MSKDFLSAIKKRRSIYAISKESPISDERILEIVEETVTHVPSSFNSQSTRVVVLFGDQHYNPLIDEKVKADWSLPESWKLVAQMPFGKPTVPPEQKEFIPIEERVIVV